MQHPHGTLKHVVHHRRRQFPGIRILAAGVKAANQRLSVRQPMDCRVAECGLRPQHDVAAPQRPQVRVERSVLGEGYVEALRATYDDVPESVDYVMYWWHKAAELTRRGEIRRFGFITTNSFSQTFARRVADTQLHATPPLSIVKKIEGLK